MVVLELGITLSLAFLYVVYFSAEEIEYDDINLVKCKLATMIEREELG